MQSTLPQDATGKIQSLEKAMGQLLSTNTMQGTREKRVVGEYNRLGEIQENQYS